MKGKQEGEGGAVDERKRGGRGGGCSCVVIRIVRVWLVLLPLSRSSLCEVKNLARVQIPHEGLDDLSSLENTEKTQCLQSIRHSYSTHNLT